MAVLSEKPAKWAISAPASPKKPLQRLRQLFTFNKSSKKIFTHDAFTKYEAWEANDYTIEATMGESTCPGCASKIGISREVQRKGGNKIIDNLKFHQEIEGGAGMVVRTLPTSFDGEFKEFMECRTEKLDGEWMECHSGRKYELLWEKFYGALECVNCKRRIEFVNHVRRYEGEEQAKWFMTNRP